MRIASWSELQPIFRLNATIRAYNGLGKLVLRVTLVSSVSTLGIAILLSTLGLGIFFFMYKSGSGWSNNVHRCTWLLFDVQ